MIGSLERQGYTVLYTNDEGSERKHVLGVHSAVD